MVFLSKSEFVQVYINIADGDPIFKMGVWDSINWFDPTTILCLSQGSGFLSSSLVHGLLFGVRVIVRFVDVGGIVDHHCSFHNKMVV